VAKDVRTELKRLMLATLADEKNHHTWTYRAVRPIVAPSTWKPGQRVAGDCSKGVQYLVMWASGGNPLLDPMGNSYASWGISTTICAHLQHLTRPADLDIGDIVTFGRNGDEHAAMVLEPGPDPLLWSFGHEGAPNTYRLSQDRRERQLLRLPAPRYVPAKASKLRAKRGYWAWLQWRLGEGDWHQHPKADPNVRPRVPRLIPARWWRNYAAFVLARKKPNPVAATTPRPRT
jgi:hypothetical protein